MAPSTRRRLLIGSGGLIGLLIVVLLVAPSFIDADAFKPRVIAEVKRATGRDLVLDGPISLSLLPVPSITASNVRLSNAARAKSAAMVEVKSVTATLSLPALLRGRIEVAEARLVEPKIALEVDRQGRASWQFTPATDQDKSTATAGAARPPSVGRIAVEDGTLTFSDDQAGLSLEARSINLVASVAAIDGPYMLAGGAILNGSPLKIDLAVGAKGASGHAVEADLETGGGKLSFKGTLSALVADARLAGALSSSGDDLVSFADTLTKIAGLPDSPLPPLLAQSFKFDGSVEVSRSTIAAKDFKLALGEDSGTGSLVLTLEPELAIEGRLAARRLDLDRWLAAIARPAAPQPQPPPPAGSSAAPPPPAGLSLLSTITAKLAIEVGEVIYNSQPIKNLALDLEARRGVVAVPRLDATLPGDMVLHARSTLSGNSAHPTVSGEFSLVGPKLRETLGWLGVDVAALPPGRLGRLGMKGRMASKGGNVQVSDAVFELDDLKGSGSIVVSFGLPLSVVTQIELDTLDLDPFLAHSPTKPSSASSSKPSGAPAAVGAGPSIGLKLKVAKLIWHKEPIRGVEVDVATRGNTLRLNDIKVSNLAGARLAVRGTVANYRSARPRPDLAFNFEAPDMDRVLKLLGTTAPAGLGAVAASGGLAGSAEQLSLREFSVRGMGHSLQATGTLSLPGADEGVPKAAAYKGSLVLDGQSLEGSIDATLGGRPNVSASLHAETFDLDKIGGAGAPQHSARGQPAASAKPIDTAPLRAFDGNFKLTAGMLLSPPLRIGNADLAATLKDGVLSITHFKGALYGGSLNFSGVVNASRPALSYELKGDANGLVLGQMLRSTSGTNQFGGSIKVTVDGRLNATGIAVRGAGLTANQLKASTAGGAQLSGHIFLGADKALQVLGSAASGVVGGVLDNTLGNVLDIFGQGVRAAPTNILNAVSVVLNRFVNRDNPLSGRVEIAGGVLRDRSLNVQGDRATAHVTTRTNLATSTTDTTVSLMIAEDSSAPYIIITARGPLSSPAINLARGSAKDPPGVLNTLPGASSVLPGQGGSQRPPIPKIPLPKIPGLFGR